MKKTLLLLFVCLFVGISHAQAQVTVKGTVISSENNEPVIGASVLVKGTTNGTITDINGQFTLTNISPTNKTIIVSFIGMETQEVTIKPEMKIVMTSTTEVMEEVLVVAEGGNLAASKIRNLECPSYEICLIDYGCGKFNRKIHIMEQYP